MSDEWTRKKRKEKLDRKKGDRRRPKGMAGDEPIYNDDGKRRPRKKNWSEDEYYDSTDSTYDMEE